MHEITTGGAVMRDGKCEGHRGSGRVIRPSNRLSPINSIARTVGSSFPATRVPRKILCGSPQGADVLVHEVMYLPALERLIGTEPNAKSLREHILASHTTTEQVGRIATEAGVKTLVLSHFVPGGIPPIHRIKSGSMPCVPYFSGNLIVGRDLLEVRAAARMQTRHTAQDVGSLRPVDRSTFAGLLRRLTGRRDCTPINTTPHARSPQDCAPRPPRSLPTTIH